MFRSIISRFWITSHSTFFIVQWSCDIHLSICNNYKSILHSLSRQKRGISVITNLRYPESTPHFCSQMYSCIKIGEYGYYEIPKSTINKQCTSLKLKYYQETFRNCSVVKKKVLIKPENLKACKVKFMWINMWNKAWNGLSKAISKHTLL